MPIEPLHQPLPNDFITGHSLQLAPNGQFVFYVIENREPIATLAFDQRDVGNVASLFLQSATQAYLDGKPAPSKPGAKREYWEALPTGISIAKHSSPGLVNLVFHFGEAELRFPMDTKNLASLAQDIQGFLATDALKRS